MLNQKKTIETRDIRLKNLENLKREIASVDWADYLFVKDVITENVNQVFDKCHDKLLDIVNKHTPVRKRSITEKNFRKEAWVMPSILKCCKKQKKLYKLSIKRNAPVAETIKYQEYRKVLNRIKRKEKTAYYHDLCKKLKNNTKKLWDIVNQTVGKSNDKTCILDKLRVGNVIFDTPGEISNELATFFANVGPKYANLIKKPDRDVSDYLKRIKCNEKSLFLNPTNHTEITQLICNLPNKTSSGYDQLNNKF